MNSAEYFAPVTALDLEPIKAKLMHKESGEGWPAAYTDAVEQEYRRFLCLIKKFPDEPIAPLFDVDVFWHYHILDTMKYAVDCDKIFGYFLHHFPYSGMRGEDDEATHHQSGARMQELYEATFGEACIAPKLDHAVTAYSPPVSTEIAWCNPTTAKTAWCNPATAKTAWCNPQTLKTAWCNPATTKTAWCNPAKGVIAWCNPATTKTVRQQAAASNNVAFA